MTKSVGGDSRMILIGDRAMDDMLMGRAININPALTDVMMMMILRVYDVVDNHDVDVDDNVQVHLWAAAKSVELSSDVPKVANVQEVRKYNIRCARGERIETSGLSSWS